MVYDYVPWYCNYFATSPLEDIDANSEDIADRIDPLDGGDLPNPENPVIV